ncbi:MAG TPA: PqqD family protein [Bacteroidales bacterium]|nr:PqqD family protein [Bacteroidales bacterium]
MMFQHRKQINYLDMIPVRNVKDYSVDSGKITLLIPKFKIEWMNKWFIPGNRSKQFRIHLDDMGSRVWLLIDGKKSTGEICDLLTGTDTTGKDQPLEIEERVTRFLSQLYKNRFILFSQPG